MACGATMSRRSPLRPGLSPATANAGHAPAPAHPGVVRAKTV